VSEVLGGAVLGGAGIVGVGVDAVSVDRFRQLLERRPGFAARCFTDVEQTDAGTSTDRAQSLAARFAAKEAVMKALGTGLGGFALTDVEVRRTAGTDATRHAPYLVLRGSAASLAEAQGAGRFHVSLTHTDEVAIAFVVAEQGGAATEGSGAATADAAVAGFAGSRACAPS
jgi:holo-[acyl-carrier protein] synthase